MASPDWLRTFLAVYRVGSVTDAARLRGLSQPAASQQLAALERSIGTPLFARTRDGMVPTERGRSLYGEVSSALDQLEILLAGLETGRAPKPSPALRVGASAELFAFEVLPHLAEVGMSVVAQFGTDSELIASLEHGELDVALVGTNAGRRSVIAFPGGERRFKLVAPPRFAPRRKFRTLSELGEWLTGRDWVAYSTELPVTRRFWQDELGRPFSANLRLVVPDLRVVLGAVVAGLGASMLPSYVCTEALSTGGVVELYPIEDLVAPESWYVCVRQGESSRPAIIAFLSGLSRSERGDHR